MLELRVLGTIDLRNAAGDDLDALLAQPKRLALLAYLAAATPVGFHRRDKLLALFWPELDQEHARASLRKAVYVVRRALGEEVLVSRGDEELGVDPQRLWCDAVAFTDAVERGELARALELYRGDLLDGFFVPAAGEFDRWLDGERQRLREIAATAAWTMAESYGADAELTHAARWVRRAMRLAPDDERRTRKAMRMLAGMGEKAGAIRLYEEFVRRMASEHEAEPAAETQALARAIRNGEFPPPGGGVA